MTAISDLCTVINDWLNRSYTTALNTSFVRQAEEYISSTLRVSDMVTRSTLTILADEREVELPEGWLELDFVKNDDGPIKFITRDSMYTDPYPDAAGGKYTLDGNTLVLGGEIEDTDVEITVSYFAPVPQLTNSANWVYSRYYNILLNAALMFASAYAVEDERAAGFKALVDADIKSRNEKYMAAKTSGSVINRRQNAGFG